MKSPNFFIVGAPKCGTTAMAAYLGEHKNIFMSSPKEPCFFSTDFPGHRFIKTEDEYAQLFSDAGDQHYAIGEGSVWYLYSDVALKKIHERTPDAKIIVMLRNPVEQVYAMYHECYLWRYEDQEDFRMAWDLMPQRRSGKAIPRHCAEPKFVQYQDIASYTGQLKKLYDLFPEQQIKIIVYDDFKVDNRKCYLDVLNFLGVPDDGRVDFTPVNESKRFKFHWLGSFLLNQPPWLVKLKTIFKRIFKIERLGVRDIVWKTNVVYEKRQPLSDDTINVLRTTFKSEIDNLSEFLGRDFSHWYSGRKP